MLLSVPIIARNVVKLNYPLDRVVKSVAGLADEVVICVDPNSEDDSLDYIYDLSLEINQGSSKTGTLVRTVHSEWDLDNISSDGAEFARQTNIAISHCMGDWVLSLQADESIHDKDFSRINELIQDDEVDAYSMERIYFYGDINTVRLDWTVPIIRLFRKGTRFSCGDAMNTSGSDRVRDSDVRIYHYSRIGDPNIISKRILSLDKLFHPAENLLPENELKPYDFSTRNFDCMHKDSVDVGKQDVEGRLVRYTGTHPKAFMGYNGQ